MQAAMPAGVAKFRWLGRRRAPFRPYRFHLCSMSVPPRATLAAPGLDRPRQKPPLGLMPQVSPRKVKPRTSSSCPPPAWTSTRSWHAMRRCCPGSGISAAQGAHIAGICTGGRLSCRSRPARPSAGDHALGARRSIPPALPKADWHPEKVMTEDRRMFCSGGVYASMDLSLYLVEKFCGHEVALQCAKALLINMPRAIPVGPCDAAAVASAQ